MLDGIAHWRPLVNGDSGLRAAPYTRAMELLDGPLDDEAPALPARGRRDARRQPRVPSTLPEIGVYGPDRVYSIDARPARREAVAASARADALATAEGPVVDLGAPTAVDRVVFGWATGPGSTRRACARRTTAARGTRCRPPPAWRTRRLSLYRTRGAGRGAVRFPTVTARYSWLDPPAAGAAGALETRP